MTLALFPWAYALELISASPTWWIVWVVGVALHSLALAHGGMRHGLIVGASIVGILGLWAVHGVIVYERVVRGQLNVDFALTSIWISAASRDLMAVPANGPGVGGSYFAYYLDPIIPFLNRVLGLTDSPARLLALQAFAILSPALVVCLIAARSVRLYPFQLLLPAAYLLHPALFSYIQADYHSAGIGSLFFFLGGYLFFHAHVRRAFPILVIGTLTKLSFWLTWAGYALVCLWRRRWRAACAYMVAPMLAAIVFWLLQPSGQAVPFQSFALFGHLVGGSRDVATATPPLDLLGAFGARSLFFVLMLACLGLAPVLAPAALLPVAPLALVSLVERTGLRSRLDHQYAAEYLGFLLVAAVLGLERVPCRWRTVSIMSLGLGALLSVAVLVPHGQPSAAYQATLRQGLSSSVAAGPAYERAVAFSRCALADRPTVVAASQIELNAWPAFSRPPLDTLWLHQVPLGLEYVDAGFQRIEPARWATFETLVYPANPEASGSLARFPMTGGLRHAIEYAGLLERLPVQVTIEQGWTYRGTQRLADCAADHGYDAQVAVPATPVRADRLPALASFPCDLEVRRLSWWFNARFRTVGPETSPEAQAVVERLLQDLEVAHATRDGAQVVCFTGVQETHDVMRLDWSADNPPPVAPCEIDLVLANRYFDTVFDGELQSRTLAMLNGATVADARKDQTGCLLATAALRRAYVGWLSSGAPEQPLPEVVTRTSAVAHRIRPDAVDDLDRFPCSDEVARLAWWRDRPDLLRATPAAVDAVDRVVHDASVKDPVTCFGEVQAAVSALGIDWRPDNPPPSAGTCTTDLVVANAYYDRVFDEELRAVTLPWVNQATLADRRGDLAGCLLAVASVRRSYLTSVGASTSVEAMPPVAGVAAELPFRLTAERAELLDRFPCRAEAERLGWWFDRSDLLTVTPRPPSATALTTRALRDAATKDQATCFLEIQAAVEALGIEWGPDNRAPAAPCDTDATLARAYVERVLTDPLRARVQPELDRMLGAMRMNDYSTCLLSAASIRRTYVDAIGYRDVVR